MAASYGDQVQRWVQHLFEIMLAYAYDELDVEDFLKSKIKVDRKTSTELVFRTELRFLQELANKCGVKTSRGRIEKDNIRDALTDYFDKYLGILKDNRENKGKGSQYWHFTLTLWASDKQKNLAEFTKQWEQRRCLRRATPTHHSHASHPPAPIVKPQENFSGSDRSTLSSARSRPYCNLPAPTYQEFIGRMSELSQLLKFISLDYRAPIITVDGIGGVGKTALVLEAAYQCLDAALYGESLTNAPVFDAIIFASAKENYLSPLGIVPRLQKRSTLEGIWRAIALTLEDPTITQAATADQLHRVYESLGKQRTLLIVDNMETLDDKQEVISFLNELPASTKAVITTREYLPLYSFIRLDCLPPEDSIRLIKQQAQEKGITLSLEQSQALNQRFGGVPVALIYAIGQLASAYPLELLLESKAGLTDDIGRFCFEGSVRELREQPAHQLLMSLAFFPDAPVWDAVAVVAGLKADALAVNKGLARLQQLSLVRSQENRYSMLSITREYAASELMAYPQFEMSARERWVKWYLDFAEKYGVEKWEDWHIHYEHLKEEWGNLLAVLHWCAEGERYQDVKQLWKYLNDCAYVYGYLSDRSFWLEWLLQTAERRGDWATFVEVIANKGWLLTLTLIPERLSTASELYARAWELRSSVEFEVQADLAKNIAQLNIDLQQYQEARNWLDINENLIGQAGLDERERSRRLVNVLSLRAKVFCNEGDDDRAKQLYRKALQLAEAIKYQRAINYIQNRLADLAISRGELDEAEHLLQMGFPVIVRNKNQRRIASYQRSFARLERARGNGEKAREWATQALEGFNRLGMILDANEVRCLLE